MDLDWRISSYMKKQISEQVIGIPISSAASITKRLLPEPASQCHVTLSSSNAYLKFRQGKGNEGRVDSGMGKMNKLAEMVDAFAQGIREHARILQMGGVEKVFKQKFSVGEGEKLLNASQCYLSTTAGPIAGLLFISTDKVAFCSEKSIKLSTPTGELFRYHYKVMIPLRKIKKANKSENAKKPSRKYMQIVTEDNFEFWFMRLLNYQKTFKYLQQAVSQAQ